MLKLKSVCFLLPLQNFDAISSRSEAAPLSQPTSIEDSFVLLAPVDKTITRLKALFMSAPVLSHPDQSLQFVVESDASDSAVGAAQSQPFLQDNKLHP